MGYRDRPAAGSAASRERWGPGGLLHDAIEKAFDELLLRLEAKDS